MISDDERTELRRLIVELRDELEDIKEEYNVLYERARNNEINYAQAAAELRELQRRISGRLKSEGENND